MHKVFATVIFGIAFFMMGKQSKPPSQLSVKDISCKVDQEHEGIYCTRKSGGYSVLISDQQAAILDSNNLVLCNKIQPRQEKHGRR